MSITYISADLRRLVKQRAQYRCEYCGLPDAVSFHHHQIDHVIAEKHGGLTVAINLAYACWRCNLHKDSDLGTFDTDGKFIFLFNPRAQVWAGHFAFDGAIINGLTAEGRVTVRLLQMNRGESLAERESVRRYLR